jgi:tetratricopeptide (TPR) repeat protein
MLPRPAALLLALTVPLLPLAAAVPSAEAEAVRALLRERKVAEAEKAARALVAHHGKEAEAHALLGSVMMGKQDPDGAVKAFEQAAKLAPKDSEIHRRLGDAYGFAAQRAGMMSKFGLARKCLAAYEQAVALDPRSLAARQSLMGFYQAAPGMAGGGIDKAYAQAAEIKKLSPDQGRLAYAQLYAAEKKWTEAFAEFEEVLKADPVNYLANFQVGRIAALSGERVDRGIETLRKALTLPPSPGAAGHEAAHWRLGMLLEKKGDKTGARTAYEAALQINPKFPQAAEALKKLG